MSNTAGGAISQSVFATTVPATNDREKSSQLELLPSGQRALDALAQLPDLLADVGIRGVAATAHLEPLVREVQRCHHRDPIQADDVARVADLAHLDVQILC